ncbi:hypothetical protein MRB53_038381 [Persea americana]|nr:hypothetical protein MRB53_038381 [Persea americana]
MSSGDESPARTSKNNKSNAKQKRRWDADGFAVEGDDDAVLDYSAPAPTSNAKDGKDNEVEDVKAEQMGSRTGKGQFVLKDLDDEIDAILASSKDAKNRCCFCGRHWLARIRHEQDFRPV